MKRYQTVCMEVVLNGEHFKRAHKNVMQINDFRLKDNELEIKCAIMNVIHDGIIKIRMN